MEETEETSQTQPSSPESKGRRSTDSLSSSSPEFEFWMVRNPSFPQPNITSADQLFENGVLRPLHLLSQQQQQQQQQQPELEPEPKRDPEPKPKPESSVGVSSSKRWKDIFKIGGEKKQSSCRNSNSIEEAVVAEEKEKWRREKKMGAGNLANPTADLNINIWPFSRSRSAGNSGSGRAKACSAGARKSSSAPCSRSNSGGESKSKKWPSSPGRGGGNGGGGVHLGRSSPVWQVRRGKGAEKSGLGNRRSGSNGENGGVRVLNLSVPLCIGYRQHLSCSSDDSGFRISPNSGGSSSNASNHSSTSSANAPLFNLRTLFSKKVH